MDDRDLAYLFGFHVPQPDTIENVDPSYYVPTPAHRHIWRKRKWFLETEKRCYFHWMFRKRRHYCYATYVFVIKHQTWSYSMPRTNVVDLKKFPSWYEEEKIP